MSTRFANDPDTPDTVAHTERPFIARMIHRLAVPIILGWLAIIFCISAFIPSLEEVGQERSVSLSPRDAPSYVAMKKIGEAFKEGNSDSAAMIVLEGRSAARRRCP